MLRLLVGAVMLVLVIAYANVATLTVAGAAAREPELAIRRALGASERQILRLLVTEAGVLGAAGGVLGLAAATYAIPRLAGVTGRVFPGVSYQPSVDGRALAFTMVTVLFGVIVAVLPAMRRRIDLTRLGAAARASVDRGTTRTRSILIVVEIAAAVVLVTTAGLLTGSLMHLLQAHLDFDADHVLTMALRLPASRYPTAAEWQTFEQDAERQLGVIPGVVSVGAADHLPGTPFLGNVSFTVSDRRFLSSDAMSAKWVDVSPTFLRTLGLHLTAGRAFTEADAADAPGVVIVNETLARRLWPSQQAPGSVLQVRSAINRDFRVVGVVTDAGMGPLRDDPQGIVYFPLAQIPAPDLILFVRTALRPGALVETAVQQLARLDPQLVTPTVRPLDRVLADGVVLPRTAAAWLSTFTAFSLLLAGGGIYGLLAFVVTQRRREFGIRMALGADAQSVRHLVVSHVYGLAIAGLTLGVAAAAVTGRLLRAVLFQIRPDDPIILLGAIGIVLVIIALASLVPLQRAAKTDPAILLRAE